MPTIFNRNLTLTTVNNETTTIRVTYSVRFSAFERRLAGLGMIFQEHLEIMGVDQDQTPDGPVLAYFPIQNLPVTDGETQLILNRDLSRTVSRQSLQEDPGFLSDEIICRIQVHALGMPPSVTTMYTDQETLAG